MTQCGDRELVERTLQGDRDAFDALVERYQRNVYAVCVSMLHDFDLARDLAQETFARAFQHLRRLTAPDHFNSWLRTIAVNECRLHVRRARAARSRELSSPDATAPLRTDDSSPEQQAELWRRRDYDERLATAALRALATLPEPTRQAVALHHLGGSSLKEVGAFLGISPAAVKMRLHRARQQLQKEAIAMVEDALTRKQLGPEFARRIQLADATILFADISGTIDVLERLPSDEALARLYECMGEMVQSVVDHGGTLHSYEGDAVVAFWGAPIPTADHAVLGCLAALSIQAKTTSPGAQTDPTGAPHLRVTCGLSTGVLYVGELGGRQPQAYTVIGMPADIANKLEHANARLGTSILVGPETYERARGAVEARVVGQVRIPPRSNAITVYEILSRKGGLGPGKAEALARYQEGFEHYQKRRWEEALPAFEEALRYDLDDGLSRFYRDRCRTLLEAPPEVIAL